MNPIHPGRFDLIIRCASHMFAPCNRNADAFEALFLYFLNEFFGYGILDYFRVAPRVQCIKGIFQVPSGLHIANIGLNLVYFEEAAAELTGDNNASA